ARAPAPPALRARGDAAHSLAGRRRNKLAAWLKAEHPARRPRSGLRLASADAGCLHSTRHARCGLEPRRQRQARAGAGGLAVRARVARTRRWPGAALRTRERRLSHLGTALSTGARPVLAAEIAVDRQRSQHAAPARPSRLLPALLVSRALCPRRLPARQQLRIVSRSFP